MAVSFSLFTSIKPQLLPSHNWSNPHCNPILTIRCIFFPSPSESSTKAPFSWWQYITTGCNGPRERLPIPDLTVVVPTYEKMKSNVFVWVPIRNLTLIIISILIFSKTIAYHTYTIQIRVIDIFFFQRDLNIMETTKRWFWNLWIVPNNQWCFILWNICNANLLFRNTRLVQINFRPLWWTREICVCDFCIVHIGSMKWIRFALDFVLFRGFIKFFFYNLWFAATSSSMKMINTAVLVWYSSKNYFNNFTTSGKVNITHTFYRPRP